VLSAARAVKDLGKRIPDDIVFTGFDDIFEATGLSPAITTVRQPLSRLARLSASTLIKQKKRFETPVEKGNTSLVVSRDLLRVESELIKRASSKTRQPAAEMSSCTTRAGILAALGYWLASANAERCFLVQLCQPGRKPHVSASVAHAFKGGRSIAHDSVKFHSADILPDDLADELRDGLLLSSPVYAGSDLYGYLLIEPSGVAFADIDASVHCIGNALRNQYLMASLEEKSRNLKHDNEELSRLANHDSLTRLPNRLLFMQHLGDPCRPNPGEPRQAALMFLDLDGLKAVNDGLGHTAGDTLLQLVSKRLIDALESSAGTDGFVSRLGGDEFTIVLAGTDSRARVNRVSDAVLASIARPFVIETESVNVTTSIGCALFPADADETGTLIARADAAMYQAKRQSKNILCYYRNELNAVPDLQPAHGQIGR